MKTKTWLAPALLCILTLAVLAQLSSAIVSRADGYEFVDPMLDVRRILKNRFVEDVDETAIRDAALRAMVDSLDDPHTYFVPPVYEEQFNKSLRGVYVGIGAEVNIQEDYLTIVTPMEDSPALEAGILAGDVVLEIAGETTFQMNVDECIKRLQGEPGTTVEVRVRHTDDREENLTVTRRQIVTRTVEGIRRNGIPWDYCVDDELGIHYARLSQFNQDSATELREVLDQLQNESLNGFILDLRDNPGGSLPGAIEISDMFLNAGTIVSVRGRHEDEHRSFDANAVGTLPQFPMIVLINQRSASASEIVSGALQDNGRAKVLGSRSFGKGSVQEVHDLPFERGTLKCTTAYYHLPSGRNLHRRNEASLWGVDPDLGLVLPMPDEPYIEMLTARRSFEIIAEADPDLEPCVNRDWIEEHIGDDQLVAAIDALGDYLQDGTWPMLSDVEPTVAAMNDELDTELERRIQILEALALSEETIATLQGAADGAGVTTRKLPEDADVQNGILEIRDRLGNVIATYQINGGNLELALQELQLERLDS